MVRCSMNDQEYGDVTADGIWDDGEFISWDWINGELAVQERRVDFPTASPELVDMFDQLVDAAIRYKEVTGRHLPLFGELGELYAEITFGIKRHRPGAQGSDGKLGNDFVEVKTMSPDKRQHEVQLDLTGNFSKVIIVKINKDYSFEAHMLDRSDLKRRRGNRASALWPASSEAKSIDENSDG